MGQQYHALPTSFSSFVCFDLTSKTEGIINQLSSWYLTKSTFSGSPLSLLPSAHSSKEALSFPPTSHFTCVRTSLPQASDLPSNLQCPDRPPSLHPASPTIPSPPPSTSPSMEKHVPEPPILKQELSVLFSFFFFGHTPWLVGSWFPDQGLNPGKVLNPNH